MHITLPFLLPGAIAHLGEPIRQLGFRLGDTSNFVNAEEAQFKVNVKGSIDKGIQFESLKFTWNIVIYFTQSINQTGKMHLWAAVKDGEWNVTRIELELNKQPDKRFLIHRMVGDPDKQQTQSNA